MWQCCAHLQTQKKLGFPHCDLTGIMVYIYIHTCLYIGNHPHMAQHYRTVKHEYFLMCIYIYRFCTHTPYIYINTQLIYPILELPSCSSCSSSPDRFFWFLPRFSQAFLQVTMAWESFEKGTDPGHVLSQEAWILSGSHSWTVRSVTGLRGWCPKNILYMEKYMKIHGNH